MKNIGKITQNEKIVRVGAILLSVVLSVGCLTACGGEGDSQESMQGSTIGGTASSSGTQGSSGATDSSSATTSPSRDAAEVVSSNAAIHDALNAYVGKDSDAIWAGVQVLNDEVVEIWRKPNGAKATAKTQDVYLFDSKEMGKVIVTGAPTSIDGIWFYTDGGYCLNSDGTNLSRVEADGTVKYTVDIEGGVRTIVQLDDGTVVVLMKDIEGIQHLATLDPEKGQYRKVENLSLGKDTRLYIASDEQGVVVMNRDGFWNVNLETGELTERMPMSEYNYTIEYAIRTFQMVGGGVKLLSQDKSKTILPTDIEKYRTVIELFAAHSSLGSWMDLQIENFNMENPYYYVEVVSYGEHYGIETEEELLKVMDAGEGPDLFYGYTFENVHNIIDKGYLEDLAPYMEASGIYEEDYFPTTFESYKRGDGIYGAPLTGGASGLYLSKEVLGDREVSDVEGLVDALIAYTEPSVIDTWSKGILEYLISASESLCGTVDWESGTCDFNTNLFSKILEVSKLYGVEDENMLPVIGETYSTSGFYGFINEEAQELSEKVYLGYFFDDGLYPAASNRTTNVLYMNKNAANKEGAWALIADLLGEQSQMQLDLVQKGQYRDSVWRTRFFPVNIYAYDMVIQTELEETALVIEDYDGGRRFTYKMGSSAEWQKIGTDAFRARYSLTEQDAKEMLELMYEARVKPIKTLDLQAIIYEEAAYYFSDERSLGDTCEAIQKRAQEYLDGLK